MKEIKWLGHFPSFSQPEAALMAFLHLDAGEGDLIPAESCKNLPLPLFIQVFSQSLRFLLLDGRHILIKSCRQAEHRLDTLPSSYRTTAQRSYMLIWKAGRNGGEQAFFTCIWAYVFYAYWKNFVKFRKGKFKSCKWIGIKCFSCLICTSFDKLLDLLSMNIRFQPHSIRTDPSSHPMTCKLIPSGEFGPKPPKQFLPSSCQTPQQPTMSKQTDWSVIVEALTLWSLQTL